MMMDTINRLFDKYVNIKFKKRVLSLNIATSIILILSLYYNYDRIAGNYESSQHDLRAYIACAHNILAGRHIYRHSNKRYSDKIPEDPSLTEKIPLYKYPPLMGILMIPATIVSYDIFKHVWYFLNLLFVFCGTLILTLALPTNEIKWATFAASLSVVAASESLDWLLKTGQADAFILLLIVLSLHFYMRKQFLLSALMITVACWSKVTPGLLCIFLLTRGEKKFFLYTIVFGVTLFLVQILAVGDQMLYFFTTTLTKDIPRFYRPPVMQSLWSLTQLVLVPYKGVSILSYPALFDNAMIIAKLFIGMVTLLVLVRRCKSAIGIFQAFAVLSCVSVLIAESSWVMRFIWNVFPIVVIVFFMFSLPNRISSIPRALVGLLIIFLNCTFLLIPELGPLDGARAALLGGSGFSALFSMLYITVLYLHPDNSSSPRIRWKLKSKKKENKQSAMGTPARQRRSGGRRIRQVGDTGMTAEKSRGRTSN
jgi:hypothetical protein